MQFNKNSGCVKVWVTLIVGGTYEYKDVPNLLNLQEQVKLVLVDMGAIEDTTVESTSS
ncbi:MULTISPECIES: hypothetical protein [Clostridium]|uniref:Uncharacterized protein n=1 Tax=Candidatus Clostridium helianthi TaxID=3381660 RepID=A0ABW8S4P2_9CLOT|nr:hypothetical protein [Clostridium beijerinckii]MBA8935514.1 hypothetical protein [Clostridium beijerinckii]NRU39909.1 hypothetical protein [Clostridium beijerinckii]NSA96812.1 hypothetical protein [Clostridium beijerinckii]OOM56865.1 hypothetical protein CLOBI_42100 [Clostridium beijerinckii]OOM64897.1 hypothetical protein CLBEIC_54170 [Clostridium beijerinckii]